MTSRRAGGIAFLIVVLTAGQSCMAIERAKYVVVTSEPPYEIRDYASSVVAIVTVDGTRNDAVNAGFRLLARYIFGHNQQNTKIAMTAPVTQMPNPANSAGMSAQGSGPPAWIVRFMMPDGYTLQSLPAPSDSRVRFEQSLPHRAATVRFSGFWSDANLKSHEADLQQWMSSKHLSPQSAPVYAYYDPPWTPWFMRTIEVLIDMAPPSH